MVSVETPFEALLQYGCWNIILRVPRKVSFPLYYTIGLSSRHSCFQIGFRGNNSGNETTCSARYRLILCVGPFEICALSCVARIYILTGLERARPIETHRNISPFHNIYRPAEWSCNDEDKPCSF